MPFREYNCLFRQLSGVRVVLVIGFLCHIRTQCMARAINLGNTWTMPAEAANVFYRFFRDRISWFEADAVCQFHHANLVTVENSYQFDATRDLLRELDVNDIVWIGLMRPQNSNNFIWSGNSMPASVNSGYWAESLPLLDAQLCAVIDPIRDYRWHALRCSGPETASFLCEMAVPNWADACLLRTVPNVTIQYMADTATVELIRNCQEEGLLQTSCSGKEEHEQILSSLMCPRERLEIQHSYINKPLQIIKYIPTDNNENNNIEVVPFMDVNYGGSSLHPLASYTDKNEIDKVLKQFNVEELIQGHEGTNKKLVNDFYKFETSLPEKKSSIVNETILNNQLISTPKATANEYSKQNNSKDKYEPERELTTQHPIEDATAENFSERDLRLMMKTKPTPKEFNSKNALKETNANLKPTMGLQGPTMIGLNSQNAGINSKPLNGISLANLHEHNLNSQIHKPTTTFSKTARTTFVGIAPKFRVKQSENNSPFIPPMLLVKSHYVSSANKPLRQFNYKVNNDSYNHIAPHKDYALINESSVSPILSTELANLQRDLNKQQDKKTAFKSTYKIDVRKEHEFKATTSKSILELNYSPLATYSSPLVNITTEDSAKYKPLKVTEPIESSNSLKLNVNANKNITLEMLQASTPTSQGMSMQNTPSSVIEIVVPIFNRQRRIDNAINDIHRTSAASTPSLATVPTFSNAYKITTESIFYKPNRHRTLTKPQSSSYIKRILG